MADDNDNTCSVAVAGASRGSREAVTLADRQLLVASIARAARADEKPRRAAAPCGASNLAAWAISKKWLPLGQFRSAAWRLPRGA